MLVEIPREGSGKREAARANRARPRTSGVLAALAVACCLVPLASSPARAQSGAGTAADTMAFYKALDLEAAGKYRDAVPLFRQALHSPAGVNALLGLERVYSELGWADSLVAPLDTLIAANPREETYRTVQLRTLQTLGRTADLEHAFERWTHDARARRAHCRIPR